ncbi:hypothetical protein BC938DRAFT_470592 [Jimgerdemannia flammicorona]|uniref:Uncharacterized protein n=1 Tax=Jimgerdemannia flammicorona TaxID=994334 RepID=A0A433Q9V2_9FUNG|nr:hypothetical protein BC938DRAFT_470592 [Jimgerdemannia flammicorona]
MEERTRDCTRCFRTFHEDEFDGNTRTTALDGHFFAQCQRCRQAKAAETRRAAERRRKKAAAERREARELAGFPPKDGSEDDDDDERVEAVEEPMVTEFVARVYAAALEEEQEEREGEGRTDAEVTFKFEVTRPGGSATEESDDVEVNSAKDISEDTEFAKRIAALVANGDGFRWLHKQSFHRQKKGYSVHYFKCAQAMQLAKAPRHIEDPSKQRKSKRRLNYVDHSSRFDIHVYSDRATVDYLHQCHPKPASPPRPVLTPEQDAKQDTAQYLPGPPVAHGHPAAYANGHPVAYGATATEGSSGASMSVGAAATNDDDDGDDGDVGGGPSPPPEVVLRPLLLRPLLPKPLVSKPPVPRPLIAPPAPAASVNAGAEDELALLDLALAEFRRLAQDQMAMSPSRLRDLRKYLESGIAVMRGEDFRSRGLARD